MTLSPDARLYFRPTAFVDAPADGALRLAGGRIFFSAYEVIQVAIDRRIQRRLIPVDRIDRFIDTLDADRATAARATISHILAPRPPLTFGETVIPMDRPRVMAILNMTPDSFSDGGRHIDDPVAAADAGLAMAAAGTAVIDVGGESTRPGAATVAEDAEIARIVPVVRRLAQGGAVVSIDTRKAPVMAAALAAGAHIVNDVSALCFDDRALPLLAGHDCPVVLMHHLGDPQTMQDRPAYDDALTDIYDWLADRIMVAESAGIARHRIIVDPGIGFGKTVRHNLQLMNGLALFHGLGCPILLGASRKKVIARLADDAPVDRRLAGSLALALHGAQMGVQLVRVHDAAETVQALRIWNALRDEALAPTV